MAEREVSACIDCLARADNFCDLDPHERQVPILEPPPDWCPLRQGPVVLKLKGSE